MSRYNNYAYNCNYSRNSKKILKLYILSFMFISQSISGVRKLFKNQNLEFEVIFLIQ